MLHLHSVLKNTEANKLRNKGLVFWGLKVEGGDWSRATERHQKYLVLVSTILWKPNLKFWKTKLPVAPPRTDLVSPYNTTTQPKLCRPATEFCFTRGILPAKAQLLFVTPQDGGSGLYSCFRQHVMKYDHLPTHRNAPEQLCSQANIKEHIYLIEEPPDQLIILLPQELELPELTYPKMLPFCRAVLPLSIQKTQAQSLGWETSLLDNFSRIMLPGRSSPCSDVVTSTRWLGT